MKNKLQHITVSMLTVLIFMAFTVSHTPADYHQLSKEKQQAQNDIRFEFNPLVFSLSGTGVESLRLPLQTNNTVSRQYNTFHFLRSAMLSKVIHEKLFVQTFNFTKLFSAYQYNGYYIYHLRKLLI